MVNKATNETGLVKSITRTILATYPDAWTFKVHGNPMQRAGVPDILVAVEGRLIGLEVKFQRPGESREHALGRVSDLQWNEITKMRRAGCAADVVLTAEEALAVIREALDEGA